MVPVAENDVARIMRQTRLFKSNRSQAVRLPRDVAFPEGVKEVSIVVEGNKRIITPQEATWDAWFDEPAADADFMAERDQPDDQHRADL